LSDKPILVSGAAGRTGGAAINELLKMGKHVRAYVRSDDGRAANFRAHGVDSRSVTLRTSTLSALGRSRTGLSRWNLRRHERRC
jgi:uncharacterized protein YbjT (DUF2867 family)